MITLCPYPIGVVEVSGAPAPGNPYLPSIVSGRKGTFLLQAVSRSCMDLSRRGFGPVEYE